VNRIAGGKGIEDQCPASEMPPSTLANRIVGKLCD